MDGYSVGRLAELAGVTVRTLHHYDHVGLLTPSGRSVSGYRVYNSDDTARLQQILLYREMGLSLKDIRLILDHPGFDKVSALRDHRKVLRMRIRRLKVLERTVAATLEDLLNEEARMSDKDKFAGFENEHARYRDEAIERFGTSVVEDSEKRMAQMTDEEKANTFKEGVQIARELAALIENAPDSPETLALAARQHAFVNKFWDASPEAFRALGRSYADDERFRAYYDRFAPGLADFFADCIDAYVDSLSS